MLDRGRVEQVRVVLDRADQAALELLELQGQVAGRADHRQFQRLDREPGQLRRGAGGVLEQHHHVEQRVAAGVPLQVQVVHQAFEGDVLVCQRVQYRLANLLEQLGEPGSSVHFGPENEGVHEQADDSVQLGAFPAGHDGADRDVVLAGPAVQQQLARRNQRDEQGGVLPGAQFAQLPGHRGRHLELLGGTGRGAHRRPGSIGGQLQRLHPGQLAPPVRQPLLHRRTGQLVPLPHGEIRVLNR